MTKQAAEIEKNAGGPGVSFINETIYVSIISKKFESNLILVDIPGMVEVDIKDPTADSRRQIIDIITKYKRTRRTIALCVHDATQNLDLCTPLRLLKMGIDDEAPLDPKLKDTIVVLTKTDKLKDTDEIDENLVKALRGESESWVPSGKLFATNCSRSMHNDEAENKWFEKQNYHTELSEKLGCGKLKKVLTDAVTDIINTTVVPKIMDLIQKQLMELERKIEAAQKIVDEESQTPKGSRIIQVG